MSEPLVHQDWLRLVLEADGLSDYRVPSRPRYRIDWIGRSLSFISMTGVGFVVVAVAVGLAQSRPQVTAGQDLLRTRVEAEQRRAAAAEDDYLRARASLASTQDAVRPDLDGRLSRDLDEQGSAAAFTALRGPGVTLVLANAKTPTFSGTTDLGRVIDRDVQHAVNGLWAAGAEAISVDGIRLTNRTSIRNAGESILVDYTPITSPIEIRALGSARAMGALFRSLSAWDELTALRDRYGIRWELTLHRRLVVPAGTSSAPTFARTEGVP